MNNKRLIICSKNELHLIINYCYKRFINRISKYVKWYWCDDLEDIIIDFVGMYY